MLFEANVSMRAFTSSEGTYPGCDMCLLSCVLPVLERTCNMNVTSGVTLYEPVMALRALIVFNSPNHPSVGHLLPPPCSVGPGTLSSSQGFSPCLSDVQGLPVTVMLLCGHGNCLLIQTLTHGWSSCLDSGYVITMNLPVNHDYV